MARCSSPMQWAPTERRSADILLLFIMLASKGAAGVTGPDSRTLAEACSHIARIWVNRVGLIVGIDRFMSEARALTNFAATRSDRPVGT